MVIAELFSTEVSENVLAALCLQPEKLICLGSRSVMTDGRIAAVRAFFRGRKASPQLTFLRVGDRDYAGAGAAIRDILAKYPDCRFEMTGGSDLLLAALGTAAAEKPLTMFALDIRQQSLSLLRGGGRDLKPGLFRPLRGITVGEYLRLWGGELAESSYTMATRLPDRLEKDVADLWRVYIQAPQIWTKQCTILANLCARSRAAGLTVSAPTAEKCARSHIDRLLKAKLISDYSEKGSIAARVKAIGEKLEETGADGFLTYMNNNDEAYVWDYPSIRRGVLEPRGIPSYTVQKQTWPLTEPETLSQQFRDFAATIKEGQ